MEIPQVAFSKGEVSPLAADRTDTAFYQEALQTAINCFVNIEGSISNRPGLEYIGNSLSNTPNGSYLLPFVYNNQQTYVVEFAAGSMQFYSQGAFVQNGVSAAVITAAAIVNPIHGTRQVVVTAANSFTVGQVVTIQGVVAQSGSVNINSTWAVVSATPANFTFNLPLSGSLTYISGGTASIAYNLTNPYALADLPNLRWAQSADVLSLVVATQPMYQLTRITATSFTFTAPQLLFGPFQDTNTDGQTTVYASGTQGTVTLTASSGIFKPSHVGGLFYLQEQFFNAITAWEAEKVLVTAGSPVGMYVRSEGNIYQCVSAPTSGSSTGTGTFQPVHTQGTQQDGNGQTIPNLEGVAGVSWQFVSTDAGVAKIVSYISPTQVKATVQSYKGIYSNFPPTVVGGPVTAFGPFTYSGTGSQVTFTGLTGITTSDPNQFYVTVGGIFQDPSSYVINLSGTSITFYTPPASGAAISVAQVTGALTNIYAGSNSLVLMTGLCLSTYWAFGSISSIQGYTSDICYYNDRLVLSGTTLQPQTVFLSQVSNYLDFGVSNPQVDSDSITETINARQQNPINNLLPMNNLLLGTASASWRVTDSSGIGAITPSDVSLIPQEFYGMHPVPAVQTGTTIIYAQWGGRKLRDIIYQFYSDKYQGQELTVFARQMFPAGTAVTRVAYAPEPYGLIYCVRSDGVMCVCTYLVTPQSFTPTQQVIAWSRYITAGNFEDVVVVPENNSFSVYVLVGRTINGVYTRYIERFAPREYDTINDAFFVDSGLTYDGRNTSTTTMTVTGGTTWLANDVGILSASSVGGWTGFAFSDVTYSNCIWLNDANGNRLCRLQITGFVSTSVVNVQFLDPVPVSLQGTPDVNWTFARTTFVGLTNLIGQTVSIFADGAVLTPQVVGPTGLIMLSSPGGVVHAGLPYVTQIQSMELNVQNQEPIRNKAKTTPTLSVVVDESYPFMAGPSFTELVPSVIREFQPLGAAIGPYTGIVHVNLPALPQDDATVCVQMSDPAPLRITGWIATVDVGEPG
jgi:hypothetical protein